MMDIFSGLMVFVDKPVMVPKIQIPEDADYVTEEFREKHNDWLLDRFGFEELYNVKPGEPIRVGGTLIVHPADYAMMKELRNDIDNYSSSRFGNSWLDI